MERRRIMDLRNPVSSERGRTLSADRNYREEPIRADATDTFRGVQNNENRRNQFYFDIHSERRDMKQRPPSAHTAVVAPDIKKHLGRKVLIRIPGISFRGSNALRYEETRRRVINARGTVRRGISRKKLGPSPGRPPFS